MHKGVDFCPLKKPLICKKGTLVVGIEFDVAELSKSNEKCMNMNRNPKSDT